MSTLGVNEVGRTWIWQSTFQKKKENKPDIVLYDGFLFEGPPALTYEHICGKNNLICALPNQDLVLGPQMENNPRITDPKEKEQEAHNRKVFFTDMKYLRHAMANGTIVLEDHPAPSRARQDVLGEE